MTNAPYNPLDKFNLAQSIAQAILVTAAQPLAQIDDLYGAGVYALYYTGDFPAYVPVSELNANSVFAQPIYVGKAIPRGGRKGGLTAAAATGTALRDRLRQHAGSIDQAANLNLADFQFRALVVDDIWISLGENMLIEQFRPMWNIVVDGFGIKDPGARRAGQYKSSWDILHPGRRFAEKLGDSGVTQQFLFDKLKTYFAGGQVPLIQPEDESDRE